MTQGSGQVLHHVEEMLLSSRHIMSHRNSLLRGHHQLFGQLELSTMKGICFPLNFKTFPAPTGTPGDLDDHFVGQWPHTLVPSIITWSTGLPVGIIMYTGKIYRNLDKQQPGQRLKNILLMEQHLHC